MALGLRVRVQMQSIKNGSPKTINPKPKLYAKLPYQGLAISLRCGLIELP